VGKRSGLANRVWERWSLKSKFATRLAALEARAALEAMRANALGALVIHDGRPLPSAEELAAMEASGAPVLHAVFLPRGTKFKESNEP
jgi:hypothetical protein